MSLVFNGLRALSSLLPAPALALSLFDTRALTRTDVGRTRQSSTGPVFDLVAGRIVSRLSFDNTSSWNVDSVPHLAEAKRAILELAVHGSPAYVEFLLAPRQILVLANSKISHGRTAYSDDDQNRRLMLRLLLRRN